MGRALETVKKQGTRSIQDIINSKTLTFINKVSYIRHHYVYYNGNYDLFHDENGNPNETKHLLDQVIAEIIRGNVDPEVLSDFNKDILQLRKERDLEKQKKEEELLSQQYLMPEYKRQAETHGNNSSRKYIAIIDAYFNQLDNITKDKLLNASYKDMKKVALAWKRNQDSQGNVIEIPEEPELEVKSKKTEIDPLLKGYEKYCKAQGWN